MAADRFCTCGHMHRQHEIRSGGLFGCYISGCLCIDFADATAEYEIIAALARALAAKRGDVEFMARLHRRVTEDADLLARLADV